MRITVATEGDAAVTCDGSGLTLLRVVPSVYPGTQKDPIAMAIQARRRLTHTGVIIGTLQKFLRDRR